MVLIFFIAAILILFVRMKKKMSISVQNHLSNKETERSIVALFRSDNSELDFARFSVV